MNLTRRLLLLQGVSAFALSPAFAATTGKIALTGSAWTDLGAGPMLLGVTGGAVYAIGDTTPAIPKSEGFSIPSGESFYISSTSHVWGMSRDVFNVNAYVSAY